MKQRILSARYLHRHRSPCTVSATLNCYFLLISLLIVFLYLARPNFLVEPKDVRANVNGAARFDCESTGNPRPNVFWTREGNQILMFPDNKYNRFLVSSNGSLIITTVKKEDAGFYVCSALSVVGSSTAKAYLNVSSSADIPPPLIIIGPADQTLSEHTTAILPCETAATPQPTWMFNNNPISLNNARFSVLDSGTLQIDGKHILQFAKLNHTINMVCFHCRLASDRLWAISVFGQFGKWSIELVGNASGGVCPQHQHNVFSNARFFHFS